MQWILLAQAAAQSTDTSLNTLSGGAGWVGAGLLGLVLSWLLLKHLPDNAKQLRDMLADKDKQYVEMLLEKDKHLKDKDAQINTLLDHKWAAIQQMSTDRLTEVKALAAEFRAVIEAHYVNTKEAAIAQSEQCDREVERWRSLWQQEKARGKGGEQ